MQTDQKGTSLESSPKPRKTRCHLQPTTVRTVASVGVTLTAILIAFITLTPQSSTSAHGVVSQAILNALHAIGVPESFGPVQWEFTANIIMFTPLGFFLALTLAGHFPTRALEREEGRVAASTHPEVRASKRVETGSPVRVWAYLAVFPLATGFIETTQLLFLPSRYATWSDIIANSLGGFIGYGVGLLVLSLVSRFQNRTRKPTPTN